MLKKLLFLISLIIFIYPINYILADIVPLKKPSQTQEIKEQKLLIDVLRPLPKPSINKVLEKKEEKSEKKIVVKKEKDLGILLPKKKPLIAGSKKEKEV